MDYPTFSDIQHLRHAEMTNKEQNSTDAQDTRRPLLPLYRDILADMETPVSAYCKTAQQHYSFLLESVSGGEHVKRYSFIGIDPYLVLIQREETATLLHMHYTNDGAKPQTTREDVPCSDPLKLLEAELGQFRLVKPDRSTPDQLPRLSWRRGGLSGLRRGCTL